MIFKYLKLEYENVEKKVEFSPKVNLINSKKNSVGKSTLLRLLFYSMGYPVPRTKGVNFSKVSCELLIENEKKEYLLKRKKEQIELIFENKSIVFLLPSDADELHCILFGTENLKVVNNILGAIYLDQEKGWTLLNKGVVIGKIYFDLSQLVGGLADRNYEDLSIELNSTIRELKKYKTMQDIYEYRTTLIDLENRVTSDDYLDELERDCNVLKAERNSLSKQIKDMELSIKDNNAFIKYIENMRLFVTDGEKEIPVIKENIVNFDDNQSLIGTRKKILELRRSKIENKISNLEQEMINENTLISVQSQIQKFDAKIAELTINQMSLDSVIKNLKQKENSLRKAIQSKISINNDVIDNIYFSIKKYAKELEVSQYMDDNENYIFTRDLKGLSGAVLHKIVFVFKISYVIEIQKYLGIKLPIVLDSPSGREVDQENISDIMRILDRDFKENQIIIASIYDNYGFTNINKLVLDKGLFR